MIIKISKSGIADIIEPYDIGRFHIEAFEFDPSSTDLITALATFSEFEAPDHAWVQVSALQQWSGGKQDQLYQEKIHELRNAAIKYNWFNPTTNSIKAHIVHTPD